MTLLLDFIKKKKMAPLLDAWGNSFTENREINPPKSVSSDKAGKGHGLHFFFFSFFLRCVKLKRPAVQVCFTLHLAQTP